MENEKILQIRTHESVEFDKSRQNYFTSVPTTGRTIVDFTIVPELNCLLLESKTDRALVPFVNLAYIKLESSASKAAAAEKKQAEKIAKTNQKNAKDTVKRPR